MRSGPTGVQGCDKIVGGTLPLTVCSRNIFFLRAVRGQFSFLLFEAFDRKDGGLLIDPFLVAFRRTQNESEELAMELERGAIHFDPLRTPTVANRRNRATALAGSPRPTSTSA